MKTKTYARNGITQETKCKNALYYFTLFGKQNTRMHYTAPHYLGNKTQECIAPLSTTQETKHKNAFHHSTLLEKQNARIHCTTQQNLRMHSIALHHSLFHHSRNKTYNEEMNANSKIFTLQMKKTIEYQSSNINIKEFKYTWMNKTSHKTLTQDLLYTEIELS